MRSAWSIRTWLGVLVCAVALPLLLLLGWLYGAQTQRQRHEARQTALRIAASTAADLTQLHADSVTLLERMAARSAIRDFDGHECDSLFAIVDFFPQYATMFFFDSHGVLLCAAEPDASDRSLARAAMQWTQRELTERRLTPRQPRMIPVDSHWLSITAVDVKNRRGEAAGMLVLVALPEVVRRASLPPGAVVTILDRNGTIVARTADPFRWSGRNVRGGDIAEKLLNSRATEGVDEGEGVDGVRRQYGYVYMAKAGWYVYVGLPTSTVMGPVRESFMRGAIAGTGITGVVLIIATLLARAIERPIQALAAAADTVAHGGYGKVASDDAPRELAALADTFNDMIERRHAAEQRMQAGERKLKALSDHLLLVQEQERARIARELHDDLGQSLTALKMDVLGLLARSPADGASSAVRERIVATLDSTVTAVQRISAELRPSVLDDLGLAAALESEARLFEQRTGIECELSLREVPELEPERTTAVYRIVQEALTNVARHSDASRVEIRLRTRGSELLLEIRDDGRGVTEEEIGDPLSLGLIGIRERADLVGGNVHFEGVAGRGTIVSVRIPLAP